MSHADDAAAQRELNAALERFRGEPRAALALGPSDDAAAARRAFMALCKVYHPAKFARHAAPIVKLSNEVFLAIRRAYETVIAGSAAPVARASAAPSGPIRAIPSHERPTTRIVRQPSPGLGIPVTSSRAATPPAGVPVMTPRPPAAPATLETPLLEKGLAHARAQRWSDARQAFGDLALKFPGDPRYRAYLHWARGWEAFGGGRPAEARAEWQRALACDPAHALARSALESTGLAK